MVGLAAGSANAEGGASTEQSLDELRSRHQEFDSFGWPPKAWFGNDNTALRKYVDFNRRHWVDNGIGWLFSPTWMAQKGTQGGSKDSTSNYQHSLLFVWRAVRDSSWGNGTFVFNALQVFQTSSSTGVDVTGDLGLNYPISDSVVDSDTLKALYWQQDFRNGVGDLKFGHIELSGIVSKCSYLCDDTQSFIASPLSNNVANTMPGQGWGIQAGVSLGSNAKVEFGVSDANGNGDLNFDRGINTDQMAYAAALSVDDLFPQVGSGNIRLATYFVDETPGENDTIQASTKGTVVSVEQEFGDVGLTARYARADGRVGGVKDTGAAAMIWKNPFGRGDDWLGLGAAYVQPAGAEKDREHLGETFYRMQLTPLTQLTAGAIYATRPNADGDTGDETVFNIRFRAAF